MLSCLSLLSPIPQQFSEKRPLSQIFLRIWHESLGVAQNLPDLFNSFPNVLFKEKKPRILLHPEEKGNLLKIQWVRAVKTWTKRWILSLQPFDKKKQAKYFWERTRYHLLFHLKIINALRKELKYNPDNDRLVQTFTKFWLCY